MSKKRLSLSMVLCLVIQFGIAQTNIKSVKNSLLIEYQGVADSIFILEKSGTKFKMLERNDNSWTKKIYVQNPDSLIFQYKAHVFQDGKAQISENQIWIGQALGKINLKKKKLKGKLKNEVLMSKFMKEERKVTIYLPKNYDTAKNYPVIYFADGNIVNEYAFYVEKLIDNKHIPPLVLVGIHAGETPEKDKMNMAKNKRTLEYLKGISKFIPEADTTRFDKHLSFFCKEVKDYVSRKYKLKSKENLLYGFSNGSAFCLSASLSYPDLYSKVIALSIGWDLALEKEKVTNKLPIYYLAAGQLEKDFYNTTKSCFKILETKNKKVFMQHPISYHDDIMWREVFLNYLKLIFTKKNSGN